MAALPLFRNIKMATVTTRKNTIYTIYIYCWIHPCIGEPWKAKLTRWLLFFSYDYLRIRNDMGVTYGKYCGLRSGKTVLVTGSRASFHFHSDSNVQEKGFRLYLSIVSLGKSFLNFPPVKTNGFQMTQRFPTIASVPTRNIIARALKGTK